MQCMRVQLSPKPPQYLALSFFLIMDTQVSAGFIKKEKKRLRHRFLLQVIVCWPLHYRSKYLFFYVYLFILRERIPSTLFTINASLHGTWTHELMNHEIMTHEIITWVEIKNQMLNQLSHLGAPGNKHLYSHKFLYTNK